MRKTLSVVLAVFLVTMFCSLALAEEKKESTMGKGMMQGGMMGRMQDNQVKLKCAEEWLKKAIELHELHMRDPKSTTEASQMELMDQIKKAYECVTGAAVSLGSGIKEPEKQTETKTSSQHEAHH